LISFSMAVSIALISFLNVSIQLKELAMFKKEAEVNGVTKSVEITDLLVMAKDAVVEEPTATPEVKTDETTTDKEVVEKTKDGRAVYAGETVYVVKKGDCLWNIAKKLLGSGKRYNELFTRNNGVVEKVRLIFPGQEIIVPAN